MRAIAKRYMRLKDGKRIWEKAQGGREARSEALREAYEMVGIYHVGGHIWHRDTFAELVNDIRKIGLGFPI